MKKKFFKELIKSIKQAKIILQNEDRDLFLNALENPPLPNKKLQAALSKTEKENK